jgi:DNA-binding transcriptional ArsR family regulator
MEARRDVYQAIADPNRRQIINMVAQQPLNLNAVAERFSITRQAVSLHVKILEECGLIVVKRKGRERYCEARLEALTEVWDWVEPYKRMWTEQFKSLDKYLNKVQAKHKKQKK